MTWEAEKRSKQPHIFCIQKNHLTDYLAQKKSP
jgi:hypothetical protein